MSPHKDSNTTMHLFVCVCVCVLTCKEVGTVLKENKVKVGEKCGEGVGM